MIPAGWTLPGGWTPPWVFVEKKRKETGVAAAEDYKAGYSSGVTDVAYGSGWGASQDKAQYGENAGYKSGYDDGWADYNATGLMGVVGGAHSGVTAIERRGQAYVPSYWWAAMPKITPAHLGVWTPPVRTRARY